MNLTVAIGLKAIVVNDDVIDVIDDVIDDADVDDASPRSALPLTLAPPMPLPVATHAAQSEVPTNGSASASTAGVLSASNCSRKWRFGLKPCEDGMREKLRL